MDDHPRPLGRTPVRLGAWALALMFAVVAVGALSSAAIAKPNDDKKDAFEAFVGANLDSLADCTGAPGARDCIVGITVGGAQIAGFGFAIGAILKFKAHKDNPTGAAELGGCLDVGGAAGDCIDQVYGKRIGAPNMRGIAHGIAAYSVLRDHCSPDDVVCDEPSGWPDSWPWVE